MLIVGERINTGRRSIVAAVQNYDAGFIQGVARRQMEAEADRLNINVYSFVDSEAECMEWMVKTVQQAIEAPLSLDSRNPEAIEAGLKVHKGRAMVNSITGEKKSLEELLPLLGEYDCSVVALCMDDSGVPETAGGRFDIASTLVETLTRAGVSGDDIYLDPLVQPIGVNFKSASVVLETIRRIMAEIEGVHTICGLSNISSGMPSRSLLNRNLLIMAMAMGLDAVILDPLDRELMADLIAAQTLLGQDEFCMRYIAAYRQGRL